MRGGEVVLVAWFLVLGLFFCGGWFLHVGPDGDDYSDQAYDAEGSVVSVLCGVAGVDVEDVGCQLNSAEDQCNYDEDYS